MLLHDYLTKSQEIYWKHLKQPIDQKAGYKLVKTGISSSWMNGVVGGDLQGEDLEKSVCEISRYYREEKLPFSWWTELSREHSELNKTLIKHGAEDLGYFEGMVLPLDEFPKAVEQGLMEIQIVSNREDLLAFLRALIESYEASYELMEPLFDLMTPAGFEFPVVHFLGMEGGIPVSVGSLFIEDDMAGIYNIGTIPHARNKGYASMLMHSILDYARKLGCRGSFLTSTPYANNLYRRMGYQTVDKFRVYVFE